MLFSKRQISDLSEAERKVLIEQCRLCMHTDLPKTRLELDKLLWKAFLLGRELRDKSKKPRLFYYEDSVTELALMPAPDKIAEIIDCGNFLADGDEITITFKRIDMADEEFENLPED